LSIQKSVEKKNVWGGGRGGGGGGIKAAGAQG